MLKVMYVLLAVALAGTANAAGWRKLQIDASSEAAFNQSVATFQKKLSPSRRAAFAGSLRDIEQEGKMRATAEQPYTRAEYLQQLHGLGYEEVVNLVDPTGKKEGLYRAEYYYSRSGGVITNTGTPALWSQQPPTPVSRGIGGGPTYRGSPVPNTADARAACGCMSPDNAPQ
jgi:hypothetical protein